MEKRRFDFISDIKTASLTGVVVLHCMLFYSIEQMFAEHAEQPDRIVSFLCNYLNAILISSFVCCSGFLFANNIIVKKRTVLYSIKDRFKRLVVPYFLYGAFWLVPTYTFFDIETYGRDKGTGLLEGYKSMLLGVFSDHLWFLLMLFWVTLVFILMTPLFKKKLLPVMFIIVLGLSLLVEYCVDFPYYKVTQVSTYLLPFFLGVVLYFFFEKLDSLPTAVTGTAAAVFGAAALLYDRFCDSGIVPYWGLKLCGACFTWFLFLTLNRSERMLKFRDSRIMKYTREHSMRMYLLNCPFVYIYFRILNPMVGDNPVICILANFVLTMLTLYLAVWLMDKVTGLAGTVVQKA